MPNILINPTDTTKPTKDRKVETGSNTITQVYEIESDCKIGDFAYVQPSGGSTVVERLLNGDSNYSVPLLEDITTPGGADLSGRVLDQGDHLVVTQTLASGYRGFSVSFQNYAAN